ncbi:MAG: transcriptional regulator [Sphaerochaetaceae bacterium]|nr:transcriptional regulator [Sphaerochaetaceae bacterium]
MIENLDTSIDFDKARRHAHLQTVFSTFRWKHPDLLSLYEVTKLIKPDSESYKGMQTIAVNKIIGSENRYHDFSSAFYPRNHELRTRWERIDAARLHDVTLPPISVYKIGDVYFVRDGNHRVSVARSKGVAYIDAEVVELNSKIQLKEGMTINEIKKSVVAYERKRFLDQYNPTYLPMEDIVFTAPGSYPEMVNHILVHKYYANQGLERELSFKEGAISWYDNVYSKIVEASRKEHLLAEFPGQTEADLYMWLVRRWDDMKHVNAKISETEAAKDAKNEVKHGFFKRWAVYLRTKYSRK